MENGTYNLKINYDIPSNNFSITNSSRFYNYGRKKDIVKQNFNEDTFVYPRIEVLSSKLIYKDGEYIIIGELQNIDNIPSDTQKVACMEEMISYLRVIMQKML